MQQTMVLDCLRWVLVTSPVAACFGPADYRCTSSAECRWGERLGICEATHYCSYPDAECSSGAKYSDQAGEFANDCVPSGVARWDPAWRVYSGAVGADAFFHDVDVRPDGSIVAVGSEELGEARDPAALFVLFEGDGTVVWAQRYDRGGLGDDVATAVTSAVGSEIFVAGDSRNPTSEGWLAVVEPADGHVEKSALTGQTSTVALAYMHHPMWSLVVVGYGGMKAGARAFTDMLIPTWVAEVTDPNASMDAVAVDGVADIAYGAGWFGNAARIVKFVSEAPEQPLVALFDGPLESGIQGLEYGDDALVLGGFVDHEGMRDGWVQRLTSTGEPQWSWSSAEDGEDEVEDVAITATGHIIAVGFVTGLDQDARVWKLSPTGELVWTWAWDEPLPNQDVARAVAVYRNGDREGDIIVVGERTAEDGAHDAWIVRLTP